MVNKNNLSLLTIPSSTINELAKIVAKHAASSPGDSRNFFKLLVESVDMPEAWMWQIIDGWTEDVRYNALRLIKWAKSKGTNQEDPNPQFTLLGGILNILLDQYVGQDDARIIAAVIVTYQLCLDDRSRENMAIRYKIPQYILSMQQSTFDREAWLGHMPDNDLQLQGYLKADPPLLEIEFLKHAIEQANTVCRLELPEKKRQGTGFLIANNLVLTNYHLLKWYDDEDMDSNAHNLVLCFGHTTSDSGQTFKLIADNPILRWSPTDKLDYALLQIENKIAHADSIKFVHYDLETPKLHTGIHIIQHPQGEAMQVAINSNGIARVYQDSSLVHYVTKTKGGSSGSPCFNENWKVVALHHAERSTFFGSVGEGILFSSIYKEIEGFLPK